MSNQIQLGDTVYSDEQIISANAYIVRSIDGGELQYDTFNAVLDLEAREPTIFRPKGSSGCQTKDSERFVCLPFTTRPVVNPSIYKYGTETTVICNGKILGKFFLSEVHKISKTRYEIKCISAIGILDNSLHYGGIYSTGIRAKELLDSIFGNVVTYSIDDTQVVNGKVINLSDIMLFGWVPIGTRRENLHQVLFAMGATVTTDPDTGELKIIPLTTKATKVVPSNRVFKEGSIEHPKEVRSISLTEHSYTTYPYDTREKEEKELFTGEVENKFVNSPKTGQPVRGGIIEFKEPMSSVRVEGSSIIEEHVNYVLIAPSPGCKVFGVPYIHGTRQLTYSVNDPISTIGNQIVEQDEKEKKLTVSKAWLISLANSERVAERLLSYYRSAKTITTDIKVHEETPGDTIEIVDPFDVDTTGIIESMDISLSHFNKAKTRVISDYAPPIPGNIYNHVKIIDQNGQWTPPQEVERVKLVLIGGGQGGFSGEKGHDGKRNDSLSGGGDGKGGVGGVGGSGGKIFITSTSVTPGVPLNISIGAGGAGGAPGSGVPSSPGSLGKATTVDSFSSDDGTESTVGFFDIFTGSTYGTPGKPGVNGGGGLPSGGGDKVYYDTVIYKPGGYGPNVTNKEFGTAYGGGGGGAAAGANGNDGVHAREQISHPSGVMKGIVGGKGGNGADATLRPKPVFGGGCGGTGGNGGGGGGDGGEVTNPDTFTFGGTEGVGGMGSKGGKAAPGIVLIYY